MKGDQVMDAANLNQDGAYMLEINGALVSVVLGRRRAQLDDAAFMFTDNEHNLYHVYIEPDGSFVVYRNNEWDSTAVKIFEEAVERNIIKGGSRRRIRRSKRRSNKRRRSRRQH
jgi:hypothetical protein